MFDIIELFKKSETVTTLLEANNEEDVWDELYLDLELLENDDKSEDYHNYLSRGDKVNTLVKEKRRREFVSVSGNNFLKLFSSASIESRENFISSLFEYVSEVVAKKVVRPVFHELAQKLKCKNCVEQDYEPLLKMFGKVAPQISNELDVTSGKLLKYFLKMKSSEIPSAVMLYAKDREPAALALEGDIGKRRRDNSYALRGSRSVHRYVTDYRGISQSALLVELDKLFQERISELSQEERMQDVVYRSMHEAVMSRLSRNVSNSGLVVSSEKIEKYPDLFGYLESTGMKICSLPKKVDNKQCKVLFGVYPLDESGIAYCAPFVNTLPRSRYVEFNSEYIRNLHDVYMLLFKLIYGEWKQTEQTRKYMRELNGSARVFETKRNIPDKYLKAMCESRFNEFFGYVEIDEECDLDSIGEIEKEFLVMKQKCFGRQKFAEVSLRFRKLGRHRALGLYFPFKKCLCVDIRCPSSMGHEYLHMVDFEQGELSAKYDFLKVRECYKRVLNVYINKLPADDALRDRLKGSSKYNLDYYLEPTEIFARCGELFFTKLKGVDNSLLKPQYDFSYPANNEELMSLIDDYYSVIFGVLSEECGSDPK